MTTITIKHGEKLKKTSFNDLEELQIYLTSFLSNKDFYLSLEEEKELDQRYQDMKSGKEKGISWNAIKTKFEIQITS